MFEPAYFAVFIKLIIGALILANAVCIVVYTYICYISPTIIKNNNNNCLYFEFSIGFKTVSNQNRCFIFLLNICTMVYLYVEN